MLLKIITNNGTTRLIADIQDAEIHHRNVLHYGSESLLEQVYKLASTANPVPMGLEYYDSLPQNMETIGGIAPYSAQIIEYKKDNIWRKLAIHEHGYLCNDDGKTIAKIKA